MPPARASCAEACARLRPAGVVASVSVTIRTGRSVPAAYSATARVQDASAWRCSTSARWSARMPCHPVGTAGATGGAGQSDHDRVDRPGRVHRGAQCLGRTAEVARRFGQVAGDRPRLEGRGEGGGQIGTLADDGTGPHVSREQRRRRRVVEDRTEPGIRPTVGRLVGLGRDEGAGNDGLEDAGEGDHVVRADHLDQARLVDDRHLGSAGEEHLAAAPPALVTHQVGTERPEVLGAGDGVERQPAPATGLARRARPVRTPRRPCGCWRSVRAR